MRRFAIALDDSTGPRYFTGRLDVGALERGHFGLQTCGELSTALWATTFHDEAKSVAETLNSLCAVLPTCRRHHWYLVELPERRP
jgi:hypothetical protein